MDEAHLDLWSNRDRNGIGTDDLEASDTVVYHSIFCRKSLQRPELDISRASKHFAVVVDDILFVPEKEASSWRFPNNILSVKLACLLDFVKRFIVKMGFNSLQVGFD